jgi:hypothetical protein
MLAAVAVASALMGLLVTAVLISRRQQAWLLKEMRVGGRGEARCGRRRAPFRQRALSHLTANLRVAGSLAKEEHALAAASPPPQTLSPYPRPRTPRSRMRSGAWTCC